MPTLLERDDLLAEFASLLEQAASASGRVVAIIGEAGVGKTSLLNAAATDARQHARVLVTGCEDLFTPRPLGPLYDIAADLDVDPDTQREKLFPAVLAAIASVPTLLIVEDVHWADCATLDLLKYIARRIARTPVLLAISYRDDAVDASHPLITLMGETTAHRLRVNPLSRDAVASMGGASDVYDVTGGNAFYVTEVLACGDHEVPSSVRDAVLARARALSPGARNVIEIASLMPGRAEISLIDASPEDFEAAARSGIVHIEHDAVVFRHELARRALEDSMSDVRRIPIHRATLEKLRGHRSLARIAHHAVGARDADAILEFSPRAAREAPPAGAHREAAAQYSDALAWSGALDGSDRAELLERLAYECYLTTQIEEALQLRSEALAIWKERGDLKRFGDDLRWQSRLLWLLGRNGEAKAKAHEATSVLEPLGSGPELAMAYSNESQLHMLAQEQREAIRIGTKAIDMATALGEREILAHALNNVGCSELEIGDCPATKLKLSLAMSLELGLEEHAARGYGNLGASLLCEADYAPARQYLDEGIAWCADRDLDSWTFYMMASRSRLDMETARFDAAEEAARLLLARSDCALIHRVVALTTLGRLRARRGSADAGALLDEACELAKKTGEFQRMAPVASARAEAAWLRGDIGQIGDECEELFAWSADKSESWARGDLAIWLWHANPHEERWNDLTWIAKPYALLISGKPSEASAAFERAGRPYESAVALLESDDPSDLQRGMALLEPFGPLVVLDMFREKLRSLGVRGPRASTRQNFAGLTAREVEILKLVDDGLRNADIADRLYVSPKTVDHHMSSILAKLGARTRGEAARRYRAKIG
jgi:DNA-binding CsgD family transcriptional regulator/tetratricopeptide (TPR) repeat protein